MKKGTEILICGVIVAVTIILFTLIISMRFVSKEAHNEAILDWVAKYNQKESALNDCEARCGGVNQLYKNCDECAQELNKCVSKVYDSFSVELDAMGARGNEATGFGDGWIDGQDCMKSNYAIGKSYTDCKIKDVQILTGSDPNPLKINTNGLIFNNGVIFRITCACLI